MNDKNKELEDIIKDLKIKNKEEENIEKIKELEKEVNQYQEFNNNNNPIKLYDSPTLIGLTNIGATCFKNSTLQCLSQTESLTNYFLNEKNNNRIINNNIAILNQNENQLTPIFSDLIHKLWEKNGPTSIDPDNFMNKINEMNPLFKMGEAGDSKDFIVYILEQLHTELKTSIKSNNNNSIENEPLNQYDKINAFKHFFLEFQEECSIISDIFFGITETTNECLNCKNIYNSQGQLNPICYNYQIFNCLIFPLEEYKNMKNNTMQYNNNIQINNNRVSIYECFYYYQKTDLFSGENQNYCNICKKLGDSLYTSKIYISPDVLIIILNRGKGNIYDVKLDFSEEIDISQYVLQKDIPQIKYNLYGVITHIGQSGQSAHFVASCKSPINNKWYRYNDAMVDPITNIQKEIIEYGTPYILFYQKEVSFCPILGCVGISSSSGSISLSSILIFSLLFPVSTWVYILTELCPIPSNFLVPLFLVPLLSSNLSFD